MNKLCAVPSRGRGPCNAHGLAKEAEPQMRRGSLYLNFFWIIKCNGELRYHTLTSFDPAVNKDRVCNNTRRWAVLLSRDFNPSVRLNMSHADTRQIKENKKIHSVFFFDVFKEDRLVPEPSPAWTDWKPFEENESCISRTYSCKNCFLCKTVQQKSFNLMRGFLLSGISTCTYQN